MGKVDDAHEMLKVAKYANQLDWEYKPAVWGLNGEPPDTHHKVVAQIPEIIFEGRCTLPSVEYELTMPSVDIADAIHIETFQPKAIQRILNRLIAAEATVERLDALCEELNEGSGLGFTSLDREPEYPISYFQEALRTALDEI